MPATCSALGKAILPFSGKDTIRAVVEAGLPRRTQYSITEVQRLLRELPDVQIKHVPREQNVEADRLAGKNTLVSRRGRSWALRALGLLAALATAYLFLIGPAMAGRLPRPLWPVGLLSTPVAGAALWGALSAAPDRAGATRRVNAFLIALVGFVLLADLYWLAAL